MDARTRVTLADIYRRNAAQCLEAAELAPVKARAWYYEMAERYVALAKNPCADPQRTANARSANPAR